MLQRLLVPLFVLMSTNAYANDTSLVRYVLEKSFEFDDTIIEDILYVSEISGADPMILASIVNRESDGKRQATRYCVEWRDGISKGKDAKCLKERSCYTKCRKKREVWKNRLDVGLWQLRDAPTWSWVRWYRKNHNPEASRDCAVERECSREAMIHIILYLKRRARGKNPRKCTRPEYVAEYQWIAYWNWCGSYGKHVRAARKLWAKANTVL